MKLHLKFSQFYYNQPVWWQNFIKDVDSRYNFKISTITASTKRFSAARANTIKQELELQGCTKVYDEDNQQEYLEFEDDSKATWFLMRWS